MDYLSSIGIHVYCFVAVVEETPTLLLRCGVHVTSEISDYDALGKAVKKLNGDYDSLYLKHRIG